MQLKNFLPLQRFSIDEKQAKLITADDQSVIKRVFRIGALGVGFSTLSTFISRTTFEQSPYDFDRIMQAIDTDSYARQAMAKYRELFWKEGWEIVSENTEASEYIWRRIDLMEVLMRKSFQSFLAEIADELMRYSNVFIVKARGNINPYFNTELKGLNNQDPIAGYYLIPTETVEIKRDKHNRPLQYRQRLDSIGGDSKVPTWNADEVIHLSLDKKQGRAFGTPMLISVLDDLMALRQVEEDYINLGHRELFPLYVYKIGTDLHPATQDELDKAVLELDHLRAEGGVILSHRHDLQVVGAEGNTLDIEPLIEHLKERIAGGLGLYPPHLGMLGDVNRSATDRLDAALYDKVKEKQAYFADFIRMEIFNELLLEGGFNPAESPSLKGPSDRVLFRFNDIDLDTKIKRETHILQLINSNVMTISEGRLALNMKPEYDESDTMAALQARMIPNQTVTDKTVSGASKTKQVDTTPPTAQKPNTQKPSAGGSPNLPNSKRGAGNIIRPANQHGVRTSPNVRHDIDNKWLKEVSELLGDEENDD